MPRQTNIQIRRGTASDWASVNPTLASGEIAMETDTRKIKVGDGSTAWNSLQYVRADGGDLEANGGSPSPTATPIPPTPTPTSAVATLSVSNAGAPEVNGCYSQTDTDGSGRPIYTKAGGGFFIKAVFFYGWCIVDASDQIYYLSPGDMENPPADAPTGTWSADGMVASGPGSATVSQGC